MFERDDNTIDDFTLHLVKLNGHSIAGLTDIKSGYYIHYLITDNEKTNIESRKRAEKELELYILKRGKVK